MGSFRVADRNAASSRQVQFHWVNIGDSEEVVIPFMQDGTYPPRNFATLGPSELQPPFIWNSISCLNTISSWTDTGQVSDPILHFLISQSPVFLLNSRFFYFHDTIIAKDKGLPFSKVTELICRVPSILFSQAP